MLAAYLRLLRLHQRTGIWLLLWPCWWGIALAQSEAQLETNSLLILLGLFLAGSALMRGAGCIINDLWDRDIDAEVARTRLRPLASGELTPVQAFFLLALLLLAALAVLWMLPPLAQLIALILAVMAVFYPLAKRVLPLPQLVLALTFNGALAGYAAVTGGLSLAAWCLYGAAFFWILGYDTIYAHQDKKDDARLGLGSSALVLGESTRFWVGVFYALMLGFLALAGWAGGAGSLFYPALLPMAAALVWQVWQTEFDEPASCMRAFKSNGLAGWLVFFAFFAGGL